MHGYGFLVASLTIATLGIGFYLVGPTISRWHERLKAEVQRLTAGASRASDTDEKDIDSMHSIPRHIDNQAEAECKHIGQMSRHARVRSQQRAISPKCVPLVRAYGRREYDGRGAIRYIMTKDAMAALEEVVGRSTRLDRLVGVYIVVSAADDTVITIGHWI